MIPEERRNLILQKLRVEGYSSMEKLIEKFDVSRITIQRDISELLKQNQVQKIHGGVKLKKQRTSLLETVFERRLKQDYEQKMEIAGKALNFVQDHSTIFIDSSTTGFLFGRELLKQKFFDVRIITNSPAIIQESIHHPEARLISTGGELRHEFNMFAGPWVIEFLAKVNIDSAFISTAGISPTNNLTTSNPELAEILKTVLHQSIEVNLLADSSKFYKTAMLNIAHVEDCTRIISDKDFNKKIISDLRLITELEIVV